MNSVPSMPQTSLGIPRKYLLMLPCLIAITLALQVYFFNFTLDDAYISFRYADNLSTHGQLTWNLGEKPVEGYSNPLWVVLLAAIRYMGGDLLLWSKYLGIGFSILNILLTCFIAFKIFDHPGAALISGLLLSAHPYFALWGIGGMEVQMAITLALSALTGFILYLEEEKPVWAGAAGFLYFLASVTRPEFPVFFLANIIFLLFNKPPAGYRGLVYMSLSFIVPYMIFISHRYFYYGYLLPNSVYAKIAPGGTGKGLLKTFSDFLPLLWLFLYSYQDINSRRKTVIPLLLLDIFIFLVVVFFSSPIMNFADRLFLPVYPLVFALSGLGIYNLWARTGNYNPVLRIIFLLYTCIFLSFWYIGPVQLVKTKTDHYHKLDYPNLVLAAYLKDNFSPEHTVAAVDCGMIPFYSKLRCLDLWGLNDEFIAHNKPSVDESTEYVMSKLPDVAILNSMG